MKCNWDLAERTGFEPATSNVTGWRSNRLNYRSKSRRWDRDITDTRCAGKWKNASLKNCFQIPDFLRAEGAFLASVCTFTAAR